MSTASQSVIDARTSVIDTLSLGERFVLVTHEHPDGDALGSLVAMQQIGRASCRERVYVLV